MGTCLDRGIKVVVERRRARPRRLRRGGGRGGRPARACRPRSPTSTATTSCRGSTSWWRPASTSPTSTPASRSATRRRFVSANAYLGCWGIVEALERGADIVVTGRTTDAAVVCGPAAWHHGWARDDWDALAGAVVAGHVIECGTQATGGNYSFFTEVPGMTRTGFPWAEIAADGSSRDRQARRHRRRGVDRHRHVAAPLRDRRPRLPRPRRHRPLRHDPARAGRPGPRARPRRAAASRRRPRSRWP